MNPLLTAKRVTRTVVFRSAEVTAPLSDSVVISGNCVFTGTPYSVVVPYEQFMTYQRGALVQDAFPDLPAEDREFIISAISPEGWKMLGPEDD